MDLALLSACSSIFGFNGCCTIHWTSDRVDARCALLGLLCFDVRSFSISAPARPPPDQIDNNDWYVEHRIGKWQRGPGAAVAGDRPGPCWYYLPPEARAKGETIPEPHCGHYCTKWTHKPVCCCCVLLFASFLLCVALCACVCVFMRAVMLVIRPNSNACAIPWTVILATCAAVCRSSVLARPAQNPTVGASCAVAAAAGYAVLSAKVLCGVRL